ncbi:MAG: hypothetical protein E7354_02295 [Clostridiales bacterium]|nr:hypothetical protein [Clostridiales bacterium]
MNKLSELISTPVISLYEGQEIGIVYNISFNFKSKKYKYAYILNEHENIMYTINLNDIYYIGQDCIFIKNLSFAELKDNIDKELKECQPLLNLKIYNMTGEYLGISKDAEIEDNFTIRNIITDREEAISYDKIVNIGSIILVGNKKININKFSPTKKIKVCKKTASDHIVILNTPKTIDTNTQNKIITDSRFLIGRRVTHDIRAINGEIIARTGNIINKEILTKASNYGKLIEVSRYSTNK